MPEFKITLVDHTGRVREVFTIEAADAAEAHAQASKLLAAQPNLAEAQVRDANSDEPWQP
jgi:hypothetical protein